MPSQYTLSPEAVSEIDTHLKNNDLISAYQVVNREMANNRGHNNRHNNRGQVQIKPSTPFK